MTLTAADVAEIMRLVEQSGFDEVILEVDGVKLCLRKGAAMERTAADGGGRAAFDGGSPARAGSSVGNGGSTAAPGVSASAARASAVQGTAFSGAATSAGVGSTAGGSGNASAPGVGTSAARASATQGTATGEAATPAGATHAPSNDPSIHDVPSPLLGTFYRSPKPGAPPFVEVGSEVEENTVVAIIEVMKLMNTVRAGVRGTVTEILVADGALAEYSQPLLRVRKAG